ncbi:MAG TPA: ABC transporter permease [Vicinamibacterales bacterium]|nr:ABC transporter permease [Vicinamibacterales bacterium]
MNIFSGIWRDLVYASRSLAKARAFAVVCIVSLGVGMVPVIAVPYLMRILRMPPRGLDTTTLVEVVTTRNGPHAPANNWSYPDFTDLRDANTGMTIVGWSAADVHMASGSAAGGQGDPVSTLFVSASYFRTIGVTLAKGPGFTEGATEPEAVLGYRFWQNRLASDPDIIGKVLTFDEVRYRVVGLAPEQFDGHLGGMFKQLFLPLDQHPQVRAGQDKGQDILADRGTAWVHIHARLSPGISRSQANAAVSAITASLAKQYPQTNEFISGSVEPYYAGGALERSQNLLFQTVATTLTGTVLLVVCLNIAGMMQVRGATRERELSIRQAIGASRSRLVQYLLCESLILAALGTVIASIVLFNLPALFSRLAGQALPPFVMDALRVDWSIIAICAGVCLVTTLLFGLLPAVRFSRPVILSSLKDDTGGGGFRVGRVHRVTAALQVAIAVPLLVGGGISLDRVRSTAFADLGFDADLLYAAPLEIEPGAMKAGEARVRRVSETVAQANGVASVTIADGLPLDFMGRGTRVALQAADDAAPRFIGATVTRVGDGYLDTMGIRLLRGRAFTTTDVEGAENVTIVSTALANTLLPNVDPAEALGKRLTFDADDRTPQTLTIVGVVGDFPTSQMSTEREQLLVPLAQQPSRDVFVIARSRPGEPASKLTAALQNAVRDLGPDVTQDVRTGDGVAYARVVTGVWLRQNSMRDFLKQSMIGGGAGSVILMLAALGVYGVVGLTVATRTREMAVRAALGATRRRLLMMILFDVVKLATPGVIVGMILTVAFMRLNSQNMGIPLSQVESLSYIVGAAIAVLVAVLASLGPARRAASTPPMIAMRSL